MVAIAADGYRSNYPAEYLAAHHPVLVLTVDGKAQESWPKTHDGGELGPYVIANPSFSSVLQSTFPHRRGPDSFPGRAP